MMPFTLQGLASLEGNDLIVKIPAPVNLEGYYLHTVEIDGPAGMFTLYRCDEADKRELLTQSTDGIICNFRPGEFIPAGVAVIGVWTDCANYYPVPARVRLYAGASAQIQRANYGTSRLLTNNAQGRTEA